jgi:hypothetical protein
MSEKRRTQLRDTIFALEKLDDACKLMKLTVADK